MHEYSIVAALVDQVEAAARPHPTARIKRVHVAIGELAGVETELLATAFATFRGGTRCADAELTIDARPAAWRCPKCAATIARGAPLRCEPCGAPAKLASGDEIVLQRIELELDDDDDAKEAPDV
ncbi:MAG: hydrogenase maturation nickel metallochaperone HypA [Myxococcales bacterium]|nr:hydrogenase maturation nickel metallochaperone HypA [Myxococcales bacterium]